MKFDRPLKLKLSKVWSPVYEGDDDEDIKKAAEEAAAKKAAEEEARKNKTYTQDELNKILSEDRHKFKVQHEKTIAELEGFKKSKGLTEKEKDALQVRINELQEQVMTKEQLAETQKRKLESEFKTQVEKEKAEKENWHNRYVQSTIERSILDASVRHEAFNPEQIQRYLKDETRLVEETDEKGGGTGLFVAKVRFKDTDKENKPVVLDLTADEAVKRMKDLPERFGNLFRANLNGGLGGSGSQAAGQKPPDFTNMSPEQYKEWRTRNKNLDLSKK